MNSENTYSTLRFARGMFIILTVILAVPLYAQKTAPKILTAQIRDTTLIPETGEVVAFDVASDSANGGSQTYTNGVSSVVNWFQSTNEWELKTGGTPRTLHIDLTDGTLNRPIDAAYVTGRIVTKCFELNGNYRNYPAIGNMKGLGSTIACPATIRFEYGANTYYTLRMSVQQGTGDNMRFDCKGVSGDPADPNAPCNSWLITPTGASGKNRASLYKNVTSKSGTTTTYLGDVNLSFEITLDNR